MNIKMNDQIFTIKFYNNLWIMENRKSDNKFYNLYCKYKFYVIFFG